MVCLLSVVTSVTSSYLVSGSVSGLTKVLVILASAGLSLCVTANLQEVGALVSVLAASVLSHLALTSGPGDRLVYSHPQLETETDGDSAAANDHNVSIIKKLDLESIGSSLGFEGELFWAGLGWPGEVLTLVQGLLIDRHLINLGLSLRGPVI